MIRTNSINCMDCIQGMKLMNDDSADICITSLPYNIGNGVRGNLYSMYSDDMGQDEYFTFISSAIEQMLRVTKYYVFFNFQILSSNNYIRSIQWIRHYIMGSFLNG